MSFIKQDGKTALMVAAAGGHGEIALELMKAGADITLQDKVCHNILYVLLTNYFMEWLYVR